MLTVDGLADGTEDTQARKVVSLEPLVAQPTQGTDSSRSGVELGKFVGLDKVPVARGVRVCGNRLEDDGGGTDREGAVGNVGVARDPADVGHAAVDVTRVDVKDVLDGKVGAEEVAGGRVEHTLGWKGKRRQPCSKILKRNMYNTHVCQSSPRCKGRSLNRVVRIDNRLGSVNQGIPTEGPRRS